MSNRSRSLGQLVKAVHTAEQNLSALINRALAPMGISRSQLSVLARFSTQPNKSQSITSLVAGVDMNQPAVTKIVGYLIEKEWLISEADPSDARKKSLYLTPDGLGVVIKAYSVLTPVIDEAFEEFEDEAVQELLLKLNQFNNHRG